MSNGGTAVGIAVVKSGALAYWSGGRIVGSAIVKSGQSAIINPAFLLVAGQCPSSFPSKLMASSVNVSMDMSAVIPPGLSINGISTAIAVYSGVDDEFEEVFDGDPTLVGNVIVQPVQGGVALTTYAITFEIELSDGSTFAVNGFLPVTPF